MEISKWYLSTTYSHKKLYNAGLDSMPVSNRGTRNMVCNQISNALLRICSKVFSAYISCLHVKEKFIVGQAGFLA